MADILLGNIMESSPSTSRSTTPTDPSAEDSVWGWQQNSDSFGVMGQFLFENHHLSDVVLYSGGEQIKAHKFILASTSPTFEEMFYQNALRELYMAEDKAVVEVLLKLIYGFDHFLLLTVHNVSHVFRAAEKYKVHVAIALCEEWIGENMNAVSCLSWLETTQQFPPGIFNNATVEKCWNYIDQYAAEVVRSPRFLNINHKLLMDILKRDSLNVDEYDLYEAALRWADKPSKRASLSNNPRRKRTALGEALYQIRFTLMSAKEFGDGPAQSGILLPAEVSSIFLHMVTDKKPPIKFVTEPRIILASGTFQVDRFPDTYGRREFVYDGRVLDSVRMWYLHVWKRGATVRIKIFTGADQALCHQEYSIIGSTPSTRSSTGPACISSFDFDEELFIPRSTLCTIQCGIEGRDTDFGINGKGEASAEVILDNGNSVMYRFAFIPGPANEQRSVRSLTSRGQIPTILFRP